MGGGFRTQTLHGLRQDMPLSAILQMQQLEQPPAYRPKVIMTTLQSKDFNSTQSSSKKNWGAGFNLEKIVNRKVVSGFLGFQRSPHLTPRGESSLHSGIVGLEKQLQAIERELDAPLPPGTTPTLAPSPIASAPKNRYKRRICVWPNPKDNFQNLLKSDQSEVFDTDIKLVPFQREDNQKIKVIADAMTQSDEPLASRNTLFKTMEVKRGRLELMKQMIEMEQSAATQTLDPPEIPSYRVTQMNGTLRQNGNVYMFQKERARRNPTQMTKINQTMERFADYFTSRDSSQQKR